MVEYRVDSDGIARIQMRDTQGRNSLGPEFVQVLSGCFERLNSDPDAQVCLLTGLDDVFCAGADQETLLRLVAGELEPADIQLARVVLDVRVPIVAAMQGHAIGGGLALGLCADLVVIARESRYGCSFMNLGFTPGMGMTGLLEQVLSPALAREMLFTGRAFRGSHFEGRSGFNDVLPRAQVLGRGEDLARQLAEKPREALELLKCVLAMPRRQLFEENRTLEMMMHHLTFRHPETRTRIETEYGSLSDQSARG